jgi:predicted anti-sigma-YlaC factor YlaD
MMDCASARRAMLQADPAELAGDSESELGRHLQTCAACRAAAAAILAAERGLGEWLAAARPQGDAAEAAARAAATAHRRAAVRRLGAAGSLLAAAAAAAVLLLPRGRLPGGAPLAAATPQAVHFSVTAPPGSDVVVMHTSNPKIIVVWYLPSRRTS